MVKHHLRLHYITSVSTVDDVFRKVYDSKPKSPVVTRTTHTHAYAGLERKSFDNKTVSFEKHVKEEHNMWHYLYFIVLIKVKDPTEFTGPESYVYGQVEVNYCIFYHLKSG